MSDSRIEQGQLVDAIQNRDMTSAHRVPGNQTLMHAPYDDEGLVTFEGAFLVSYRIL